MIVPYDAKKDWSYFYLNNEMAFPSEYVIRIFKGEYPRLNLKKESFKDKKICDVGCGDGRNLVLLKKCGFQAYGVEITKDIVDKATSNLQRAGISDIDVRIGTNASMPFDEDSLDYLLSWNACYYMGQRRDFENYVKEFARVTKPDGYLILSIPKKSCFIYHQSECLKPGYQIIKNDPFNLRNGEVLRMFNNEAEIQEAFSVYFTDFVFGSIEDDCFGFDYHWHLIICRKKRI